MSNWITEAREAHQVGKPTEADSMNRLRVQAEDKAHQMRGALLWLLWHHQGASSVVGLACRRALGMGQFDRLTDSQVEDAKEWEAAGKDGVGGNDGR
ncbi:MAG TPA: hypothetical protein VFM98_03405 [Ramlibacter sp.]|uniref:hypothetical protein n=1 Tax=Ramlibacter sp. TaxID=1917967 RepID=UPI002D7FAD74|nr:hypothetical protein [Ramlibacter sp.]HET8744626.1 hypothetical protein [Ramlibacter sp.]